MWAIVISNWSFHYAFYVVMNWLPTYFEQVRLRCCTSVSVEPVACLHRLPTDVVRLHGGPASLACCCHLLCHASVPLPLQVLHANLAAMGTTKALPYLLMFAASNAGGERAV